jgi:membrane protein DedA with SNARE-associated domain
MEQHVLDLLTRDGWWALFTAQTLGILGLPIPGELLLTLAGDLVRRGDLRGPTTIAAAISGTAAGTTVSYALGRAGARVLQHLPGAGSATIERADRWFRRSGKWVLLFSCFIPGIRHVTAIVAGSRRIEFWTFCAYAYPGVALWAVTFIAIGYYAGHLSWIGNWVR